MPDIERYVAAATRENTRRSYQSAIRHFEIEWGGFLPASADAVARYLADHAGSLSVNTLRARLAALAQWHQTQGFPDPTKTPQVRKVLKGIAALHPATEKRAKPLQLAQLERLAAWLDEQIARAQQTGDTRMHLSHLRNRALVLLGFWRGFRSDDLSRLCVEHVTVEPGRGMTLFLPRTKGDRALLGTTYKAPALSRLCPVAAYEAWITAAGLTKGPVFRSIDRWGHLGDEGLHAGSFVPLLRALFRAAGIPAPESYSSHSLRRGFASWANSNGWDVKMLMEYVGWKDVRSAMRYVDAADPFAQHRIESALSVEGAVRYAKVYDIDELLKLAPLEERVYRLRCVEGWSMVIPWIGVPLSVLVTRVQPTGAAKYVQFLTLDDPSQMPGLATPILDWPYSEGLRMDEAMHPLTLLTMGLYGQVLPNQDGAPVRIVVPWKYGFKSAKSIVKIRFVERQPPTSWNTYAPNEYGFYSNVNPNVDHPRWSQATERRIGEDSFFTPKRKTLMFNGYGDLVASMYRGMDLKKYF